VNAVRSWEDPMLRVGGMAAERAKRADDGDVFYGAEQKLPLFGKPALARRVARAEFVVESANAVSHSKSDEANWRRWRSEPHWPNRLSLSENKTSSGCNQLPRLRGQVPIRRRNVGGSFGRSK